MQLLFGNPVDIRLAYTIPMSQPDAPSLAGYRVAVTAARRARELCILFQRRGATVAGVPAITMVHCPTMTNCDSPQKHW